MPLRTNQPILMFSLCHRFNVIGINFFSWMFHVVFYNFNLWNEFYWPENIELPKGYFGILEQFLFLEFRCMVILDHQHFSRAY